MIKINKKNQVVIKQIKLFWSRVRKSKDTDSHLKYYGSFTNYINSIPKNKIMVNET